MNSPRPRRRTAGVRRTYMGPEHGPYPPAAEGIHDPTGETANHLDGQPPPAKQGSNFKPYDGT